MNHGRQQELDFPRGEFQRGEQLALLRAAVLPATVGTTRGGVRGALLKSVLKAIDDHGRGQQCYVKAETLAREVGCSLPHVKRAIEALESLSLICRERKRTPKGPPCNHYWIVWNELALLDSRKATKQSVMGDTYKVNEQSVMGDTCKANEQSVMGDTCKVNEQSVMVLEQSVMVNEQSVMGDTYKEAHKEAHKEPPPPATSKAESSVSKAAVEVEEDDLIRDARALGLFDVNAVNAARANGWTDIQLRQLFVEFEQRRKRWGETIRNPCGLLRTWLNTLPPANPIPWPDTEPQPTIRREPSEKERAERLAQNMRRQGIAGGHDEATIERVIRRALKANGFSPEDCRAAGYSIDNG